MVALLAYDKRIIVTINIRNSYGSICWKFGNLNFVVHPLETRGYARFDFRADRHGVTKLLEVNPNPGWCWDGKLNLMAGFEGMRYSETLGVILDAAEERLGLKNRRQNDPAKLAEMKP